MELRVGSRVVLVLVGVLAVVFRPAFSGDLRSAANRFDEVIIAPSPYVPVAGALAAFRGTHDGLRVVVVPLDSILDQFGPGMRPDSAVRNFIQYALRNWTPPAPEYFLLAGNLNALPSHYEPEQLVDPAHVVYDSLFIDQWFVEPPSSGGGEPALTASIGRLPAWDSAGLAVMVSKIIMYGEEPAGDWSGRAISLADFDEDNGGVFESDAALLASALTAGWPDTACVSIRGNSPLYMDAAAFRRLWSNGAGVITYCGHASPQELSASGYLTCCSVDSLCNGSMLPLALLGGCDLRFDGNSAFSVPEQLLSCGMGGAVAVVASEGLMFEGDTQEFLAGIVTRMAGHPGVRAGDAFVGAKNGMGNPFLLRRYTFLGDPATRVKQLPNVASAHPALRVPARYVLDQNYPNPFNPATTISYTLGAASLVELKVFTAAGKAVATLVDAHQSAGVHSVRFDGTLLGSGVYYYRLLAGGSSWTRMSVLLK